MVVGSPWALKSWRIRKAMAVTRAGNDDLASWEVMGNGKEWRTLNGRQGTGDGGDQRKLNVPMANSVWATGDGEQCSDRRWRMADSVSPQANRDDESWLRDSAGGWATWFFGYRY
ncbi:unnamed protein product [Calypogeia fissa]